MHSLGSASLYLPHALLVIAAIGAAISWVRPITVPLPSGAGLAAILLMVAFLLWFGVWGGYASNSYVNYFAIGGLVPYSDAGAYFLGSFDVSYGGRWNAVSSIRPMAAALRDVVSEFGGLYYPHAIMVQAVAVSLCLFFAAFSIARWLGLWSAIAFVGFALILFRPFLGSTNTEPLGLMWSFCSVAFIAEAMRTRSFPMAALAVTCMTAAQLTRAGAMLIMPAMMLWAFIAFWDRRTWLRRAALLIVAATIPAAVSSLLSMLYAAPNVSAGWNLWYTLCPLARATDWLECNRVIAAQGVDTNDIPRVTSALIDLTRQSFVERPAIFFEGMRNNVRAFVSHYPEFILTGYPAYPTTVTVPGWVATAMLLFAIPGLVVQFRRSPRDLVFWAIAIAAVVASSAIVFASEGWRSLYSTHALAALLLVIGWRSGHPSAVPSVDWRLSAAGIAAVLASMLITPAALHLTRKLPTAIEHYSGRAITGFVVIPDDATPPPIVHSMKASEFARMVSFTALQQDMGNFVEPMTAAGPFSVFWTAQMGHAGQTAFIYFGPASILARRDVARWLFTFKEPEWRKTHAAVRVIDSAKPAEAPPFRGR